MKTLKFLTLVTMLLCTGCSGIAHAEPTTKPSDLKALKLSDAVDLNRLLKDGEPDLSHQLHLSRGGRIYFGTIDSYDSDDRQIKSQPIIAKKNGDSWKALPIRDERLKDAAWSYVGGGPMRGELWGVLDASLDDDQPDLILVHSTDGATTFELTALHKPDAAADFDSFCIGPDMHGRVTLYLSPDPDAKSLKAGYYHFRTTDGGKTWSRPDYEPDVMWPAKDVPDEDQPATPDAPARKVSWMRKASNERQGAKAPSSDRQGIHSKCAPGLLSSSNLCVLAPWRSISAFRMHKSI